MSDNELIKNLQERIEYQIEKKLDIFIENQELKKRTSKLVSENTKLQNDLFSEQLLQDETDNYIEKLKKENKELNELINHVKELSNYHERKKLKYKEENNKLKEENKTLIELKNIWFDSHRLVSQERDKLLNELTFKK